MKTVLNTNNNVPHLSAAGSLVQQVAMAEERLPFTVRIVHDEDQLAKAVFIRHAAYNRHVPDFAAQLREPEPYDHEDGTVVLLAESRLDGAPLGTMRIQTNRFKPLNLESSLDLPDWLQGRTMAQASRLGVGLGAVGRMVKVALFKAYYLYCVQAGIDWMVIAARSPLDRQYDQLLFQDVYPGMGYIPIKHAKNMPHRVLAFDVLDAERLWEENSHPLFKFVFRTTHPDMDLSDRGMPGFRNPMKVAKSLASVETAAL